MLRNYFVDKWNSVSIAELEMETYLSIIMVLSTSE